MGPLRALQATAKQRKGVPERLYARSFDIFFLGTVFADTYTLKKIFSQYYILQFFDVYYRGEVFLKKMNNTPYYINVKHNIITISTLSTK